MRANRLKALWAQGKPAINGWCSMPGGFSAELMAQQGWDSVTIDTQHGVIGYSEMLAMLQAVSTTEATPLVRVAWNQPGEIMRALDAGAYGVICPMVNDAAECAAFVAACRYPPQGIRSSGPTRAAVYGGADYHAHANDEMLALAMIETAAGLANVEAIVATPGLDGVYIGPSDLSLGIGGPPGQDSEAPALLAAFDRIVAACKAAGVRAGVHTNSLAYSQKMIGRGFDLVTVGSDIRYLMGGRREAAEIRSWLAGR
ncbi:aldolase/citrate lyase family protein [Phenylobacterium sp.]|uniref:HpcH/HpaI aldolase family protein n=1 Tax=Phenylobacterium sp. TaxID=1871053 RepID=UPI0011F90D05|nr:aldolase/citrate lyase family protein [Phenylobacterium sp.]THD58650.1 MAG: 2,4-dihydroxyhept-2-ene-1,7-dioic acid aldolase [Phenylobacterium sp.]